VLTPKRNGRDNWFRAVDDPTLGASMLQAHKLRTAYERQRERHREIYPPLDVKRLEREHGR
jgi:hypothetical protein